MINTPRKLNPSHPMLDYDQVIAGTADQKLNLGQPRLRLLPPPEELLDPVEPADIIAWAKALRARGLRFRGTPVPEPEPKQRREIESYVRLRREAHQQILAALPATIHQLVAATGRSKPTLHNRLHELLDEGRVHAVRLPGRAPAYMWHATPTGINP